MAHEWCWVLVPLGHESLTPSTASLRVPLSQGSKARCKTFMFERQQYPIHHSWANGHSPRLFTFPSTLTTMMGTYYVKLLLPSRKLSQEEDGVHNVRDFHVRNNWATCWSWWWEQLEGRSESWEIFWSFFFSKRKKKKKKKKRPLKGSWFGNKVWLS